MAVVEGLTTLDPLMGLGHGCGIALPVLQGLLEGMFKWVLRMLWGGIPGMPTTTTPHYLPRPPSGGSDPGA